jgi:hypothetical protein
MSWNPITWFSRTAQVQQPISIESIPQPQEAKYFFGPQAYAEHNLGKILDTTIPPIPEEYIECLSQPSPFPVDWNRPIGENHLLVYIPGNMDANPHLPALHCTNDDPKTNRYTLKSWYETYGGRTPSWFLVPLNAQPNYDLNPNPELTFQGPASGLQYSAVGGYGGILMYISLEVLKLQNTEIKYIDIPNSEILRNEIWSLGKIPS